jgi:hypothetical protein
MTTNTPPSQTPAGWYPGENGQERYWDGSAWTDQTRPSGAPAGPPPPQQGYYQPGPPPKKKHTLRNVLLILLVLFLLCVGGCIALIGGAANEVDKSVKKEQANDRPEVVKLGASFKHDGYTVHSGWKLARDFGTVTIKGLRITNVKNDSFTGSGKGRSALLTFRFYNGTENLAEVICNGKELQEGESSGMDCSSTDKFPKGYKTIKVADTF